MKRKSTQQATATNHAAEFPKKNKRSKIPRRKRTQIYSILSNNSTISDVPHKLNLSFNSTSDEISCNTTLDSVTLPPNAAFPTRNAVVMPGSLLKKDVSQVSVSENSFVESCSVFVAEPESKPNHKVPNDFSKILHSPADTTATVEQKLAENNSGDFIIGLFNSDLACTESFSYDEYEVSSMTNLSEIFSGNGVSELDDLTDTPSLWLNSFSGSQFSEKSSDDSTSPCFSLFKEISQQFLQINSSSLDNAASSLFNDQYFDENAYYKFESEDDEENYRRLRSRESNQASKVKEYVKEYDSATVYGGLITEQRLLMVNWILETSRKKDLQGETTFLAVRLLDRFLSKGFFTNRKNLQLLGIACLTLAIRIEENQPYNSVQQKSFFVGNNVYCRYEVVAMEWAVQNVLNFHCFSPTIYSFLWFYLKVASADEEMQRKAKYLAGLSLLDYRHLRFWPSTIAAALVFLLSILTDREESSLRVMEAHIRTKVNDLPECLESLEWLVKYALEQNAFYS
ncbi:cyclin-SDS-like [Amaranthus tricolor]|uniref:cyclin-SDS-like n=1 Tax=Amaranthus tricolor TaxID=29722 RepID=UPI0025905995|nr:cyclin-SDS-like [Amaranthus tricolor]